MTTKTNHTYFSVSDGRQIDDAVITGNQKRFRISPMVQLKEDATINPGRPGCKHVEEVTKDWNNHEIGRCACGRVFDYTIIQQGVPMLAKAKVSRSRVTVNYNDLVESRRGKK